MNQLALNSHKNNINLLAYRTFQQPVLDASKLENVEEERSKAVCGTRSIKCVIQKKFYQFWLQVGYY